MLDTIRAIFVTPPRMTISSDTSPEIPETIRLILIRGLPGSGKTTLAKKLLRELTAA